MFYNDFALIYADGFQSLLGSSSALFISKTDAKKSIFPHKNSAVFFCEIIRSSIISKMDISK